MARHCTIPLISVLAVVAMLSACSDRSTWTPLQPEPPGTAVAETVVPPVSGAPDATLTIPSFTVGGLFSNGRFHYLPKLILAETTGRSSGTVVTITFELLDVGPSGGVPPYRQSILVPAGGTVVLDEDPLGYGPWLEIYSTAKASRVSVVVSFVDIRGRGGSVAAVAEVSR